MPQTAGSWGWTYEGEDALPMGREWDQSGDGDMDWLGWKKNFSTRRITPLGE
jgi:hypothetical protein